MKHDRTGSHGHPLGTARIGGPLLHPMLIAHFIGTFLAVDDR